MNEKIVIEFNKSTGYALVKMPGAVQKYVVCRDYDVETGGWGAGSYHDDLAHAVEEYYNRIGLVGYVQTQMPGLLCSIRWCEEDLRQYLIKNFGDEYDTSENIEEMAMMVEYGEAIKDRSIEIGWEVIDICADLCLLSPKTPED